jgi:hypothetical protein
MLKTSFPFAAALLLAACGDTGDASRGPQSQGAAQAREASQGRTWDQPDRTAKQALVKPEPMPAPSPPSLDVAVERDKKAAVLAVAEAAPPVNPLRHVSRISRTDLIAFDSAPFPYAGREPRSGQPFLNVSNGRRRGHRTWTGQVYWEDETYNDPHVLLHIPRGFDYKRPAVLVLFFHGHGATLERDVRDRQQVAAQVAASGVNAVLVAPQLAKDARDSSVGKLWEPQGTERFLDEAATQLSRMLGDPLSRNAFATMPVVVVAYSGGYVAASTVLSSKTASKRVRGLVLLDALYGDTDKFASWASGKERGFFVSSYATSTRARNGDLEGVLKAREVPLNKELPYKLRAGSVNFISTAPGTDHRNFVNRAWTEQPIRDLLRRLGGDRS